MSEQSITPEVADNAPEMETNELEAYLNEVKGEQKGTAVESKNDDDDDESGKPQGGQEEDVIVTNPVNLDEEEKTGDSDKPAASTEDKSDDDKGGEQEQEFTNIVDYLDKTHELKLNTDNLPKDLTREQEAEIVSDLFERTLRGTSARLQEYQQIEEVLKDAEVADFIKAKSEGKTMRDFVTEYAKTPAGKGDEAVIADQLLSMYPEMTQQEIDGTIESYKDRGVLEKMATSARKSIEEAEVKKEQEEAQRAEQEFKQGVENFSKTVSSAKTIYGIPLTDDMKKDVLDAVTLRNEKGLTYMEQVLQQDEGLLLAALGILHMETLMKATKTTSTNRTNKKLVDKLFESASDLQSKTTDDTEQEGFNAELADRF